MSAAHKHRLIKIPNLSARDLPETKNSQKNAPKTKNKSNHKYTTTNNKTNRLSRTINYIMMGDNEVTHYQKDFNPYLKNIIYRQSKQYFPVTETKKNRIRCFFKSGENIEGIGAYVIRLSHRGGWGTFM